MGRWTVERLRRGVRQSQPWRAFRSGERLLRGHFTSDQGASLGAQVSVIGRFARVIRWVVRPWCPVQLLL